MSCDPVVCFACGTSCTASTRPRQSIASTRGAPPATRRSRAAGAEAELAEHVRDEHSTFTWLLEPMMQRSGFAIEDADYSEDGIFAKYVLRRL